MPGRHPSRRLSDCTGKRGFDSPILAHQVSARRSYKRRRVKRIGRVYRCPHCGQWHIGSDVKD